ncbi:MAG TPA: phosphoribosylanthranilate isomerase, partial [Solirubrobacteraceae bacterium]|nr:phosphoribosylanthranilate isomerase [Solirubrobacteraceae bacterium]
MSESPPKVKICGVTDPRDAELAVALGAWAIGMVFHEPSPRRCSTEQALRIERALRRKVELCGVF